MIMLRKGKKVSVGGLITAHCGQKKKIGENRLRMLRKMSIRQNVMMLLIVSFALGLFGCVPLPTKATQQDLSQIERSRIFNKDFDSVWTSVAKTTFEWGYTILNQDKNSGTIFTNFRMTKPPEGLIKGMSQMRGKRDKLNIFVEKKSDSQTQVSIKARFELTMPDGVWWFSPDYRMAETIHLERDFLDAIQKNMR